MTVLYAGCSFTAGVGWGTSETVDDNGTVYFNDCKDSEHLWVNQLHSRLFGKESLENIATGGHSNLRIFQTSAKCMLEQQYSHAFVQWTTPMRHEWSIGLETWDTLLRSCAGSAQRTINLHNNITYPGKYIQERFDKFILLEHEHYRLTQLLEYVSILNNIARLTNTNIYFINGLCKWDKNFFTKVQYKVPSETTGYTQELLDLPNRDDDEYKILYDQIHTDYEQAGTILEDRWLNLYNSMESNKIDTNKDNSHLGIKSNKHVTATFIQALNTKS